MKLLFICSGNICRSPMAAEYARHRAATRGMSHLVVDSAGTLGIIGSPASRGAIRAMEEIGLDLRDHRSKGLSPAGLRTSDLVVVMTLAHLAELQRRFPGQEKGSRHLLRAFEGGAVPAVDPPDLEDPMGQAIEAYRAQLERIVASVDHLLLFLEHSR